MGLKTGTYSSTQTLSQLPFSSAISGHSSGVSEEEGDAIPNYEVVSGHCLKSREFNSIYFDLATPSQPTKRQRKVVIHEKTWSSLVLRSTVFSVSIGLTWWIYFLVTKLDLHTTIYDMPLFHLSRSEEGNRFLFHDSNFFESFLLYIVQKIKDFPIFLYFLTERLMTK